MSCKETCSKPKKKKEKENICQFFSTIEENKLKPVCSSKISIAATSSRTKEFPFQ